MQKSNSNPFWPIVLALSVALALSSCEKSQPKQWVCETRTPQGLRTDASAKPNKVFVFIHGWGGDEHETWGCFLDFLRNDENLSDFEVVTYRYPSSLTGHSPSIENISAHLGSFLDDCCANFDDIVFVAHSMGGIVAKEYILQVLRRGQNDKLKVDLIFLIATPNFGVEIAKWIDFVPGLENVQLKQIKGFGNPFLVKQSGDWNARVFGTDKRIHPSQIKYVNVEVIFGTDDRIVDIESARGLYPYSIPVFKGHVDIVKPESPADDIVKIVSGKTLKLFVSESPSI